MDILKKYIGKASALYNFTISANELKKLITNKPYLTETDYKSVAEHLKVVLSGIIQQGNSAVYLANIFQNKHLDLYHTAPRLKPLLILLRDIICFYFTETELREIVDNTYADTANNINTDTQYKVIKLFEIIATAIQFIDTNVMKFAVDVCVELQIKSQENMSQILDEISECEYNAPFNYFRIGLNVIEEISSDVETMCRFITLILIIYFIYLIPDYAMVSPCGNNAADIFCSVNHTIINTLFIKHFPSIENIKESLNLMENSKRKGGATCKRKKRKPKMGKHKTRKSKTKQRIVTGGQNNATRVLNKITEKISNVAKNISKTIRKTHQTATSSMIIFAGVSTNIPKIVELYTNYATNSSTDSINQINNIVASFTLNGILPENSFDIITKVVHQINRFRIGNSRLNEILNLVVMVIHPFFAGEFTHDVTSYTEVKANASKYPARVKSFYELIISVLNYLTIVKNLPENTKYSTCVTKHFDLAINDAQDNLQECYSTKNKETIKTLKKTIEILKVIAQSFHDKNIHISTFVLFLLLNLPIINRDTDEDTRSMSGQSDK